MFFNELPSNTSAQVPLIIVGFGFTPAQSALFNVAKPLWGCVLLLVSAAMLYGTDLGTGYTCAISYLPCIIGGIIEVSIAINLVAICRSCIMLSTALLPMVKQSSLGRGDADLIIQAILSSRPFVGWNDYNRTYQEDLSHVLMCRCCSCRQYDFTRVSI